MRFYLARNPETDWYEPFFHLRRECAVSSGIEVQELDESELRNFRWKGVEGICSKCSRDYLEKALKARPAPTVPEETPSDTKVYRGVREEARIAYEDGRAVRTFEPYVVTVNGMRLNPRFDLVNHSPDGFSWGYNGSGPAQLAFAILCDLYGEDMARDFYQDFKERVVGNLPETWRLTEAAVFAAILEIQDERASRLPEEAQAQGPTEPAVLDPMRTADALLTQIMDGEISCPAGERCITKPPPQFVPRVIGVGDTGPFYVSRRERPEGAQVSLRRLGHRQRAGVPRRPLPPRR